VKKDPGEARMGRSFGEEEILQEEGESTGRIHRRESQNPADHQISEKLREV
jgi:hypothetical protein